MASRAGSRNSRSQAGPSRSKSASRPGSSRSTSARSASSSRSKRQSPQAKAGKRSAERRGGQGARHSSRASESQRRQARPIQGSRSTARTTWDHDEIRRWAEERKAQPACVRRTGGSGDVGMIRLDFPGYSGAQSLEPISWDEWFQKFDESNLALLYQDTTARGQRSNFNKLVGRETAEQRARGVSKASRRHPERATTNASGRATGRRSAKRDSQKAEKQSRRGEPTGRARVSQIKPTRQAAGRSPKRRAA